MNKIIVEVGSTVTKVDLCDGKTIKRLKEKPIWFKKNYSEHRRIIDEDFQSLVSLVQSLKEEYADIYVCGTSIFRALEKEEEQAFLHRFKGETGLDFHIVSQDEESECTVLAAVRNVEAKSCVFVGGGGSCEIAIYEKGIKEAVNVPFGVIDVMNQFPDLADDTAKTSLEAVMEYIRSHLDISTEEKADILILAGGGHEKFARLSGIKYEENTLFKDETKSIMMDIELRKAETRRYFEEISLDEIRNRVDDPKWWFATRAMAAFVLVVAEVFDIKYVIPTDLSMAYGIIEKL